MSNKKLVAAAVIIVFAMVAVIMVTGKMCPVNKSIKPAISKIPGKVPAKAVAKKTFAKDAGGLTVKVLNYKGDKLMIKGSAFIAADMRSSVYKGDFTANSMQELPAGTYDIVVNTTPRMIYKGITVSAGRETVKDIESMGAITVKMLNSKKLPASYPVHVFSEKYGGVIASGLTNRPIDIIPGTYEAEIGGVPSLPRKTIRVSPGKEVIEDIGCITGSMTVKVIDTNGKEVRSMFTARRAGTKDTIATSSANAPLEIKEGLYDVEISIKPLQVKNGVKITSGENSAVEFTVAPQAVQSLGQKTVLPGKQAK